MVIFYVKDGEDYIKSTSEEQNECHLEYQTNKETNSISLWNGGF
jgi:hypothetical protein